MLAICNSIIRPNSEYRNISNPVYYMISAGEKYHRITDDIQNVIYIDHVAIEKSHIIYDTFTYSTYRQ